MPHTESIRLREAKALAMQATGLLQPITGKAGMSALIERIGYVQIDAISVIERAHHHVLWSRIKGYDPAWLNQLLEGRQVFEYWGHAASYLPMADFRYYLPLMQSFVSRSKWASQRLEAHGHLIPEILARLKDEGPLATRHFEDAKRPGAGWWNWKPAKIALELLYWQGEVMVSKREGFDKVYDLRERVLPADTNLSPATPQELSRFCLFKALQAYGVANAKEISRHLPLSQPAGLKAALSDALAEGRVKALTIEGLPGSYYALASTLDAPLPKLGSRVQLLSPFDNLVIQRGRFQSLFGGDYVFEAYVPAEKRRYGYFTLPLLRGGELLGFLDCKVHRDEGRLKIRQATWLRTLKPAERQAVRSTLADFARFNGGELETDEV